VGVTESGGGAGDRAADVFQQAARPPTSPRIPMCASSSKRLLFLRAAAFTEERYAMS
jgi:hypothetical protein